MVQDKIESHPQYANLSLGSLRRWKEQANLRGDWEGVMMYKEAIEHKARCKTCRDVLPDRIRQERKE